MTHGIERAKQRKMIDKEANDHEKDEGNKRDNKDS